jgi:hypothetical protein
MSHQEMSDGAGVPWEEFSARLTRHLVLNLADDLSRGELVLP